MKALVKKHRTPGLWLEEMAIPEVKEDEVLIKTRYTSICGTDVHIYKWDEWAQKTVPTPMVIGHEFVGDIAKLGKNVKDLSVGMRVSGEGHIICGQCSPCRKGHKHLCLHTKGLGYHIPGCFADYFTLPAENVVVLPDSISDPVAAILDPYGNATHTALSFDLVGEDVLITGAGPLGIMAAAIARQVGARHVVVTDFNEYRLELARRMGATRAINIGKESLAKVRQELKIEEGFNVGLEMSGSGEALNTLIESTQNGAKIALLGLLPSNAAIDWQKVIFKMLTIKGIYGREIFSTWYKMIHMLESGLDLLPLITHQFAVDDYEEGFKAMFSGQSGKVILKWS